MEQVATQVKEKEMIGDGYDSSGDKKRKKREATKTKTETEQFVYFDVQNPEGFLAFQVPLNAFRSDVQNVFAGSTATSTHIHITGTSDDQKDPFLSALLTDLGHYEDSSSNNSSNNDDDDDYGGYFSLRSWKNGLELKKGNLCFVHMVHATIEI